MKRKIRLLGCILTGVALTVMAPRSSLAGEQGKIEGAWVITITGGVGTPSLPSWYRALATFTRDGGLIETITDHSISTGHGRWAKGHGQEFALTTLLFRFDGAGNFLGTLKARGNVTLDKTGDEFTSDAYLFEFFDPDGNLVTSGVGKGHGTRIVVQPLP
jgi:hypothetical protein